MKIEIGTKYTNRKGQECEVIDILKTFNSKDELVSVRYVTTHQFMGQSVLDGNVVATTILRALEKVA